MLMFSELWSVLNLIGLHLCLCSSSAVTTSKATLSSNPGTVNRNYNRILNLSKTIGHKTAAGIYNRMFGISESNIQNEAQQFPPQLSDARHKGQAGRIGIIGGSLEYTGAPFFAGMSALRCGADLTYIFCMRDAAIPIKTYSPELIVLPFLDAEHGRSLTISRLLNIHTLVIGPGLGENVDVHNLIVSIIEHLKENKKTFNRINLVFDADGIGLLADNKDILQNYVGNIYITPNANEIKKLAFAYLGNRNISTENEEVLKELVKKINYNAVIVLKGKDDKIITAEHVYSCTIPGSLRRCGGQGDILSGALGVFSHWANLYNEKFELEGSTSKIPGELLAAYSACYVTRLSNRLGYESNKRGMVASDMLARVTSACDDFFGQSDAVSAK